MTTQPYRPRVLARSGNDPRLATEARRSVMLLLDEVQCVTERVRTDAGLVVAELVGNALRHAGGVTAFTAEVASDGSALRLQVDDASDVLPVARRSLGAAPDRPGGFGWPIIERLAASVEVAALPTGGKRIVVVVALA